MITLFSGPKPFAGHVGLIQDNAIASWTRLGEGVEVLLLGDEPGIREAAQRHGVRHLPRVSRTASGTPRLDAMFALARESATHRLLCYANADVILLPDLWARASETAARFESFLMVGQRWDLAVGEALQLRRGMGAAAVRGGAGARAPASAGRQRLLRFPARMLRGDAGVCPWSRRVGQLDDLPRPSAALAGRRCQRGDHGDPSGP